MNSLLHADAASDAGAAPRARILVIDDEPRILNFVARGLAGDGYQVATESDGASGLNAALADPYDLVVLDLLMPGLGGHEVLRRLVERKPGQPVIVLSALGDAASKVSALEHGADDYVTKPFSLEELLARVKARLRHADSARIVLNAGGLTLDLIKRQVRSGAGLATLPEREFLLLRELMGRAGETLSKEYLLAAVWGYRFDTGSNVVDVYVRRLRAKLGGNTIKTVRGEGYRVDAG